AYISSRDLVQARLHLEDCAHWAEFLHLGATTLGEIHFDNATNSSAYVLQFANGRRIYSLSSNPNALAGKRGHVTLDEFALHPDQRLLYRVAKPVTTWGGQLSITPPTAAPAPSSTKSSAPSKTPKILIVILILILIPLPPHRPHHETRN